MTVTLCCACGLAYHTYRTATLFLSSPSRHHHRHHRHNRSVCYQNHSSKYHNSKFSSNILYPRKHISSGTYYQDKQTTAVPVCFVNQVLVWSEPRFWFRRKENPSTVLLSLEKKRKPIYWVLCLLNGLVCGQFVFVILPTPKINRLENPVFLLAPHVENCLYIIFFQSNISHWMDSVSGWCGGGRKSQSQASRFWFPARCLCCSCFP